MGFYHRANGFSRATAAATSAPVAGRAGQNRPASSTDIAPEATASAMARYDTCPTDTSSSLGLPARQRATSSAWLGAADPSSCDTTCARSLRLTVAFG